MLQVQPPEDWDLHIYLKVTYGKNARSIVVHLYTTMKHT